MNILKICCINEKYFIPTSEGDTEFKLSIAFSKTFEYVAKVDYVRQLYSLESSSPDSLGAAGLSPSYNTALHLYTPMQI